MSSTFSCYHIARSGMYSSQRALNVTGHNISNANTAGYVRQQAMHVEKYPMTYGNKQVGSGVDIAEVRQIRSIFIDNMYRNENSTLGYWNARAKATEDVETILDATSEDTGLATALEQFFQGWEEVSKDPQSRTAREAVREYGNDFVEVVNQLEKQLAQIQKGQDQEICSMVEEINTIAAQVAGLNKQTLANEAIGDHANDYRDELNSLLDTLSGYVDIRVSESADGMYNVTLGGVSLVNGTNASRLSAETNASNGAFTTVLWEKTGMEVKLKGGKLLGLIEARGDVNGDKGSTENGSPVESGSGEEDVDYDSGNSKFSPDSKHLVSELRKGLNMLVSLMTRKVNAIHRSGIGLDGSTGVDFFVKVDENLPFEAGNIKVNPALDDPNKIAASGTGASGDAATADEIVDFSKEEYFQTDTSKVSLCDFYTHLVDWLGTVGKEAKSSAANQGTLVQQMENKKQSLSAVAMDEELANMMTFQHAYSASVQVINTIDAMMDNIINRMGIVGR